MWAALNELATGKRIEESRLCCHVWRWVVGHLRERPLHLSGGDLNNSAMNVAWALMSSPLMFRTCPFLIIAIAS
jgi:hypothetical protein